MLEPGRQQVPCRVKSAGTRVKRVIFGLGEVGRPDQQGPRRIEASRSDIIRKPLGAMLFGLGRLHRLDEQRVDERGNGRSGSSVLRGRRTLRKGAESEAVWLFPAFMGVSRAQRGFATRRLRRADEASSGNGAARS